MEDEFCLAHDSFYFHRYIFVHIPKLVNVKKLSFKQNFFSLRSKDKACHIAGLSAPFNTVCAFRLGRVLSVSSSCHGLIYLEEKHSLGRLESGCHQAFLMFQMSNALVRRAFHY